MTTQELIKKMRDCVGCSCCFDCKHYTKKPTTTCENNMLSSAADRLEQLENQLATVTAERDKAVEDLKENSKLPYGGCHLCKHRRTDICKNCMRNDLLVYTGEMPFDCWQWRGLGKDGEANGNNSRNQQRYS